MFLVWSFQNLNHLEKYKENEKLSKLVDLLEIDVQKI